LIGGLIAFFLARGVSNPITALTQSMRGLAAGNFDVVLPGLARKDEVGNIARAVDEFKVRAAEKAQREAAEKAEQDRRAEVEGQAALTKMADEFQTAVGDIVQAAAAGDFSQRVALDGKTGLALNVGTLIKSRRRCAISFRCWRLWPRAICPSASFRNIAAISAP
jgi:methyl-accepting chemotaxis protein